MEQMERLSNMEVLTLGSYKEELSRGLKGLTAKISWLQTKEVKVAQEVVKVVETMIKIVGKDATADELTNLSRIDRLKVANETNKTVEEIAIMIAQVQNMDLMQRTLRKRRLEGKPIPPDQASLQTVIKKDAREVMSKMQKDQLKKRQMAVARTVARRKR